MYLLITSNPGFKYISDGETPQKFTGQWVLQKKYFTGQF